jgi:ribosomal protein S18 acetylase RimI-like enzyme
MISVRPARPEDLERLGALAGELVRLHHRTDPKRFFLIPDVEKGYAWWLGKQLDDKDAVVLVATKDDRIIGYAYGSTEERDWNMLLDDHGAIHDVLVDESERRGGAGKKLVLAIASALEARGAKRIVLHTMVGNEAAQKLFAACGFRPTMLEMIRT